MSVELERVGEITGAYYDNVLDSGPRLGLSPRHEEIARRIVAGQRPGDICKEMGLTNSWLSVIVRSPMMQAKIRELSGELDAALISSISRLKGLTPDAVDCVEGVMKSSLDERLRVDTAWKVLAFVMPDRGGEAAPQSANHGTINAQTVNILQVSDPKELDRLWQERLQELEGAGT